MAKFEAFEVSIELISTLKPLIECIAQHDRDLTCQLKRAASSIALNISEATHRTGKDRQHGFRIAAGSTAEVLAALRVALSWGYLSKNSVSEALALIDRMKAMLWRLTHPLK